MCLSFIGYEGTERHVEAQRKRGRQDRPSATAACASASSPGELYDQKKFDTPYIRDFLLDRGALADVSETAAPWSELARRLRRGDGRGPRRASTSSASAATSCATCRTATTRARASTSRSRSCRRASATALDEYDAVKSAIQQAFVDNGATLSHHHAVGTEHAEWLEQDISAPGVGMLRALFDGHRPGREPEPGEDRVSDPPELDAGWSRSAPARRGSRGRARSACSSR